jgi:hypothetical protein
MPATPTVAASPQMIGASAPGHGTNRHIYWTWLERGFSGSRFRVSRITPHAFSATSFLPASPARRPAPEGPDPAPRLSRAGGTYTYHVPHLDLGSQNLGGIIFRRWIWDPLAGHFGLRSHQIGRPRQLTARLLALESSMEFHPTTERFPMSPTGKFVSPEEKRSPGKPSRLSKQA